MNNSNFIKIQNVNGETVYINLNNVTSVVNNADGTCSLSFAQLTSVGGQSRVDRFTFKGEVTL